MKCRAREENDAVYLEVTSEIVDDFVKTEFDTLLNKYLSEGKKDFHLDLTPARFVDTAGLQMFVQAMIKMKQHNATLEILNMSPEFEFSMEEQRQKLLKFISGIYPENLPN